LKRKKKNTKSLLKGTLLEGTPLKETLASNLHGPINQTPVDTITLFASFKDIPNCTSFAEQC